GEESKKMHRIYNYTKTSIKDSFFGFVTDVYNTSENILIHTLNDEKLSEGFGVWNSKKEFKELLHDDFRIIYIKKIGSEGGYQFSRSRFDIPPQILNLRIDGEVKHIA